MGLDTSHDCYHGGYGSFNNLRMAWAKAAGLPPLELMEGFYSADEMGSPFAFLKHSCEAYKMNDLYDAMKRHVMDFLPIRWACLKPDPLYTLLCHSDCDGEIEAKDCAGIADSLEKLLPALPESPTLAQIENPGKIVSIRDQVPPPWDVRHLTQNWIDGLRDAASKNENVDFH
jgi:hypothetical protein